MKKIHVILDNLTRREEFAHKCVEIAERGALVFADIVSDEEQATGWVTRGDIALLASVLGSELRALNARLDQLVELGYAFLEEAADEQQD